MLNTASTISMFACYKVYAIRHKVWPGCALFCHRVISSTRRFILYIYIFFKFTLLVNNTITPLSVRSPVYYGKIWSISKNNTIKDHAQTLQCKDRFSEHHSSRHKFSACSGNPENIPDISVSQRRLRNVQAPGRTWSCTLVEFRPTFSVCLSSNSEDLWGHIVCK